VTALGPFLAAGALLVVAGLAKAWRPTDTARALAELRRGRSVGLARLALVVRIGALAEAAVGLLAVALPQRPEAIAVATSYGGFAGFVALARMRGGALASCGCFGKPDTPPTRLHVVLDLALAGAAAWVAAAPPAGVLASVLQAQPLSGVPVVAGAALMAWLAFAAMSLLGRLQATQRLLRAGAAEPAS
jgi:hypothetical protein